MNLSLFAKRSTVFLFLAIFLYIAIFSAITVTKYNNFGYNAIDLSIYNQVFHNSTHGNLFGLTIHPHLYLGDHFELFIVALLPFYLLWQSPIMLLILQTLFLALAAWPIYLIAKKKLNHPWPLIISIVYLLNPIVHNINLFEFHILPFAIFLLPWAFYFYESKRFWLFVLFAILSLMVREDVALAIFMFGIIALIEKRSLKFILTPIIAGAVWFGTAIQLIAFFNSEKSYKYQIYFSQFGGNVQEGLLNIFTHPLNFFANLISFDNIFFVVGLTLPLALLPFLRPKYLLLPLLVFIQLLLTGFGASVLLETHYTSLLIPFLFISLIYAFRWVQQRQTKLASLIMKERVIFSLILAVSVIYSSLILGPIVPGVASLFRTPPNETIIKNHVIEAVDTKSPLAASFAFLPHLSDRENIYSLHYVFQGRQQFSEKPYALPDDTKEIAVDFNDFLIYQIQSRNISSYETQFSTGDDRMRDLFASRQFGLTEMFDMYGLLRENTASSITLYESLNELPDGAVRTNAQLGTLALAGWQRGEIKKEGEVALLPLTFYWQASQKLENDYQLEISYLNKNGVQLFSRLYPLAYGLYPTSEWQVGEIVRTNYWLPIPQEYGPSLKQLRVRLFIPEGYMGLDQLRSAVMVLQKPQYLPGEALLQL